MRRIPLEKISHFHRVSPSSSLSLFLSSSLIPFLYSGSHSVFFVRAWFRSGWTKTKTSLTASWRHPRRAICLNLEVLSPPLPFPSPVDSRACEMRRVQEGTRGIRGNHLLRYSRSFCLSLRGTIKVHSHVFHEFQSRFVA